VIYEQGGDDDEATPAPSSEPPSVRRMVFPSQAAQIAWLRQMVDRYKGNQLIRHKAVDIVFRWAGCEPKQKLCHAIAIGRWVQKHIRYINEGVETFQSPVRTLTWRHGDCDDFTTLIASLLESIGIKSELVGLEWRGMYRHIFPRAIVPLGRLGPIRRVDFTSKLLAACGLPLPSPAARIPLDATLAAPVGTQNPIRTAILRGDKPRTLAL